MKVFVTLILVSLFQVPMHAQEATFAQDVEFLKQHTNVVLLGKAGGAQVVVAPAWQGRVMTSTFGGPRDIGNGWINHELVASGEKKKHIHVFGGEDRFWLGPEGGQYALYFPPGAPFEFAHWQTPALIDTEAYDVVARTDSSVSFGKDAELVNWSKARFTFRIDRTVRLLSRAGIEKMLGVTLGEDLEIAAYTSINTITNRGEGAWKKATGLMSIWILGMFKPSPAVTVVVPFHAGPRAELGNVVNDAYFGKVPEDRLLVKDGVLYFRGDGLHRSKIGIGPRRAKPVLGAFDGHSGRLTLVHYTQPKGVTDYVNSMWEHQKEPYGGDVVNSYNDGPPEPGAKPLGPFFELESSSPAAALAPGESLTHAHATIHLRGSVEALDRVARGTLGVSTAEIRAAFASR